jgi:hypothetical protein
MAFIFMDESGDLGFDFRKKKTSRVFIVTFLFCESAKPIEKAVKKIIRSFSQQQKRGHPGVLHANKESEETIRKLLERLREKNIKILSVWLNKQKVYVRLQDEKQVLYNYVTNILLDRLCSGKLLSNTGSIQLIASKRETNKFFNENFTTYLEKQVRQQHKIHLEVVVKTPAEEKGLQAADFVSWAIFRKREHGDDSYWKIIAGRIVEENGLFP